MASDSADAISCSRLISQETGSRVGERVSSLSQPTRGFDIEIIQAVKPELSIHTGSVLSNFWKYS